MGSPDKLITGFAPELFGVPIAEEDVLETASVTKDGHCYYQWCGLASELGFTLSAHASIWSEGA